MAMTGPHTWNEPEQQQPHHLTSSCSSFNGKPLPMSPHDDTPASQGVSSLAINEETDLEESQQTQTQLELTQLTQTQELTPDESSNMMPLSSSSTSPPLSPPPVLPWGRLVPSGGMRPPVDFLPSQKEYWLGRSSTKCDVPISLLAANKNTNSKERTMLAWAHSMISNKHCRILCDNGRVFIEDQSGNGTFVNQTTLLRKGELRLLHSGDEICLVGTATLRKKITSSRVLQKVLLQYTYIFVQPSKPRRSCVNPKAMKYRPAANAPTTIRRIENFYELREKIGDGTSGQVRRAIHRQTGQEYAVKVISLRRQLDTKQMEQEVSLMRTLDHPYIVQLVDVFLHTGVAMYLVMELVAGGDLFDRIVQQERYTEVDARRAMRRLLSAIHYLHETCHIVHRDLKPENILCASPTHVKLADFGLAKIVKSDGLKTFCGTPQYFAPEVLRRRNTVTGEGRYGKPADMWSLGVILYILLTGSPPFGMVDFMEVGEDDEDPYAKLKFDKDQRWNTMPMAKDLVQQMLRLDPKRRLSVRQACDHPWINMEDGDTHVHPLDDPAVTGRKRLFDEKSNQAKAQEDNNNAEEEKKDETNEQLSQTKPMSQADFSFAAVSVPTHSFMEVEESQASPLSPPQQQTDTFTQSLFQEAIPKQQSLPNLADLNVLSTSSKMDSDNDDQSTDEPEIPTTTALDSSTKTQVAVTPTEPPVTPQDGDVAEPLPSTPIADLNQRGNRFRQTVLNQQEQNECLTTKSKKELSSPEVQSREPNKAAVTPSTSNVNKKQQQLQDDAITSQFSDDSEASDLESFPDSPTKENTATNSSKKRPLEESSEDLEQSDAKRRNKNSRQTTLSSWFVKKS